MSNEVNQAAERLRVRIEANWVYDKRTKEYERICDDAFTVVRAYLAEHAPDDDEPITEELLDAVAKEWLETGTCNLAIEYFGTGDKIDIGSINGLDLVPCRRFTRGQLRLLLRVLQ